MTLLDQSAVALGIVAFLYVLLHVFVARWNAAREPYPIRDVRSTRGSTEHGNRIG